MAKLGKYGPQLEEEAKSIETRAVPYSLYRKNRSKRHQFTVFLLAAAMAIIVGGVIGFQMSPMHWLTQELRVEFNDPALREYSGCYEVDPDMGHAGRKNYNSNSQNRAQAVFGYCPEFKHWVLFETEGDDDNESNINIDPCTTNTSLVHSSDTDAFDICELLLQSECEQLESIST